MKPATMIGHNGAPAFLTLEDMVVAAAEAVRPPERISVSEAGERYHIVKNPGQHEGNFSFDKTPYLREPTDELASLHFTGWAFVGPARTGKSATFINWMASTAITDPTDMMVVHMAQHTARDWSQADFAKALRNSPELKKRLQPGRQNDNVFDKRFLSGMRVTVTWPTISNLSGKTIPRLFIMDMDRIKPQIIDKEGHVYDLTAKRAGTFKRYGMCAAEASPGFPVNDPKWMPSPDAPHEAPPCEGILSIYNRGDRRRWFWECPSCHGKFEPRFKLLRWDTTKTDPIDAAESVYLPCPHCETVLTEGMQRDLNRGGRWIKEGQTWNPDGSITGTPRRAKIASFWMFGPAAGFTTWSELVLKYLTALAEYEKTGDDGPLMTTVTVDQGEAYIPKALEGGRLPEVLQARAEDWGGHDEHGDPYVPPALADGGFLVSTIDVQAGGRPRFVVHTYGIDRNGDIWHVDMKMIVKSERRDPETNERHGLDPAAFPEDWDLLIPQVIDRTFPLPDGRRMGVKIISCDSGGADGVTRNAYDFYRRLRAGTATRGEDWSFDNCPDRLRKYVQYLKNTGRKSLSVAQFDDDWEPIGSNVRRDLVAAGIVTEKAGALYPGEEQNLTNTERFRRFHLVKGAPSRTEQASIRKTFPDSQQKDKFAIARGDVPVWLIESNKVKDQAFNMLGREEPGAMIHFPAWAKGWLYTQLTTEVRLDGQWKNPNNKKNEAWDLLCYCLATLDHPDVRIRFLDWTKPPPWAAPWDQNSLVFKPAADGTLVAAAPAKPKTSLRDLGDALA